MPKSVLTEKQLIVIRCPFKKKGRHGDKSYIYICNRTCVKVTPNSAGEAYCKSCRLSFEFEVDSQARNTTGVRVKTSD